MKLMPKWLHIAGAAGTLRGNGRVAVIFEPLFGIPFVLFNFYMSLYMKSLGVTNPQLGYISGIGCFLGAAFAFAAGPIIDRLGRKRSTLVFDLLSWVPALILWLFARNFWMFALAAVFISSNNVVGISYMCLVVEDSTEDERLAIFNFRYICNLAVGILTPAAGLIIGMYGIVHGERLLLLFALVCIICMDLARNHFFRETSIGMEIMRDRKLKTAGRSKLLGAWQDIRKNASLLMTMGVSVLFSLSMVVSPFSSVYFAPYLTEVIGLRKSDASLFGSIISFVMILVFVFAVPALMGRGRKKYLITGLAIEIAAFSGFLLAPAGGFRTAAVFTAVYAAGNSLSRPMLDAVMARATEGRDRARYYSFCNTVISLMNGAASLAAGYIYNSRPALLNVIPAAALLAACTLLFLLKHREAKGRDNQVSCQIERDCTTL